MYIEMQIFMKVLVFHVENFPKISLKISKKLHVDLDTEQLSM